MKKVEINKIENYNYILNDMEGNQYKINIEFLDLSFEVQIKDILYISEILLKEHEMLTYGESEEINADEIENIDSKESLILIHENKVYRLNRLYG